MDVQHNVNAGQLTPHRQEHKHTPKATFSRGSRSRAALGGTAGPAYGVETPDTVRVGSWEGNIYEYNIEVCIQNSQTSFENKLPLVFLNVSAQLQLKLQFM